LPSELVLALAPARDGGLWIGTASAGVAHWHDGVIEPVASRATGLAGEQVRALLQARDGTLWAGTPLGLSRIRGGEIRSYGAAEGLPREFVISLHESADGRIWVGTSNGAGVVEGERVRALEFGPS